ncbi:Heat shock HSP 90-alpha [Sigmodon hispidus]
MTGQFVVAFYSEYLVAEKVTVITKRCVPGDPQQGQHSSEDGHREPMGYGTKVFSYLKEDQAEYLEDRRIKKVVKKQSQLIGYTINQFVEQEHGKKVGEEKGDKYEEKRRRKGV